MKSGPQLALKLLWLELNLATFSFTTCMATLDTWGALQSCDYAVPNPFSHRTRSGRIPVIPCKYKLASGRLSCSFGQSNQPTRRAPATRPQIATRSMSSNTELEQESQTNQRTGGSSWIGNGAILALGGALPGLLVAWKWDEVAGSDSNTAVQHLLRRKRCYSESLHKACYACR